MIELPIPDKRVESPDLIKVQMLKECLEHLWDGTVPYGNEEYICYALEKTNGYKESHEVFVTLVRGVRSRIGGYHSFATWLLYEGFRDITFLETQAARVRFVKQMIEEFGGTP